MPRFLLRRLAPVIATCAMLLAAAAPGVVFAHGAAPSAATIHQQVARVATQPASAASISTGSVPGVTCVIYPSGISVCSSPATPPLEAVVMPR